MNDDERYYNVAKDCWAMIRALADAPIAAEGGGLVDDAAINLIQMACASSAEFSQTVLRAYIKVLENRLADIRAMLETAAIEKPFELPTHCVVCGVVLMGGATEHTPECELGKIIQSCARDLRDL